MAAATAELKESKSLELILGNGPIHPFFEHVWQTACAIYSVPILQDDSRNGRWSKSRALEKNGNPLQELLQSAWNVVVELMDQKHRTFLEEQQDQDFTKACIPLLFRNCESLSQEERDVYDHNLWAAYLDGCSVVLNHADLQSPAIAAVCEDLQSSFLHVYANVSITPVNSQTVPPHADDRDVLVIQLYGSKQWKVYQRVPIPYPYPKEQVGKEGLEVPDEVLKGPVMIERTLHPGDVMYMPRGYVHEAKSVPNDCSVHVTVALATHDWTLLGILSAASQDIWSHNLELRKAVPREFGRSDISAVQQSMQEQIDQAVEAFKAQVTPQSVHTSLKNRYDTHNQRAAAIRQPLINASSSTMEGISTTTVVRKEAAALLTKSTVLRAATPEEKASIPRGPQQVGLHVAEAIYEHVVSIIQTIKSQPTALRDIQTPENICDLALMSVAKQCVALGSFAIQSSSSSS